MAEEETETQNAGGGVETKKGTPKPEKKAEGGVGGGGADPETQLTILTGKEMEWFFDKKSGKWYVAYGLPGSDRRLLFEATPEQMDALFGEGMRPVDFKRRSLERLTGFQHTTFAGNVAEMEGEGRFEDEVRRIKTLALDNGALPDWMEKTPAVMDIIFIAQSEGKSDDWVLDQISKTNQFKKRFPGIKKFQSQGNLTLEEAITGFLEFEAGVRAAVDGIGGPIGKVTPEVVGGLINKGYNIETVVQSVTRFKRMKDFKPAMQAFNSVLKEAGMDPIKNLQEMFDFMSGAAPAEVYDLWEASSVAEAASAAGLGDVFTAEDAMKFASATEGHTSLVDATSAFQEAAQMLLRLRNEVEIGRFGLNQEDIIDLALGQPPESGTSAADLNENINRAILSAQGSLKKKAQPFTDFSQGGLPQQVSLGELR